MPKISSLPSDSSPASADSLAGIQASGPTTQRFTLANLATFLWTLANIPTGATSPITRDSESQFAFVASGMVWSGDSYAVNKNASMTSGVCYVNGRRISIAAVTARTFTASVDTYIDVLDNGDGTGTLVYTTAVNNAASPALAANSIRIGIIVTGATTIAAAGSVNQGQETKILPIASSIAYSVTDSLGNLICSRDPANRTLGFRQITANASSSGTGQTQVTGLTVPVIVPANRKIKLTFFGSNLVSGSANQPNISIWDGTPGSGTQLNFGDGINISSDGVGVTAQAVTTPTATSKTYNGAVQQPVSGTATLGAGATNPAYLLIELA